MAAARYRLRLYDGAYEVLADRTHLVTLDLDDTEAVDLTLDRHLIGLSRQAHAAHEVLTAPRLEVCDPDTGVKILDWAGE